MRNYRYSGHSISWTLDTDLDKELPSGSGILLKDIFGVTANTVKKTGDITEVDVNGVFTMTKPAEASVPILLGQKIYWDTANNVVCAVAKGDGSDKKIPIGVATVKGDASQTTVEVRLNGVPF